MVNHYYRNTGPTHHEYHYRQVLADPGLNSPELPRNQVSKNAILVAVIALECGMPQYREKKWLSEYTHRLMGRNIPAVCAASDSEVRKTVWIVYIVHVYCVCVCSRVCTCVYVCVCSLVVA